MGWIVVPIFEVREWDTAVNGDEFQCIFISWFKDEFEFHEDAFNVYNLSFIFNKHIG